jgi:hypothetical protein
MALFTKIYGELSLRIQQSLRRCNNRGISSACRSPARVSRSRSPGQRNAEAELVESGKSDTNAPHSLDLFPDRSAIAAHNHQTVWAKLRALCDGAAIASKKLWS